jgi:hypothetical protein
MLTMPSFVAMEPDAGSEDDPPAGLLAAVDRSLSPWVVGHVRRLVIAWTGRPPTADVLDAAIAAGEQARADTGAALAALLATDIDAQRTNPLAVLRSAVRYPTDVLREVGVPEVVRDAFAERSFPDDPYDLTPATWRDLSDEVHEAGIIWGAWKAQRFLQRRRAEGKLDP